MSGIIKIELGN